MSKKKPVAHSKRAALAKKTGVRNTPKKAAVKPKSKHTSNKKPAKPPKAARQTAAKPKGAARMAVRKITVSKTRPKSGARRERKVAARAQPHAQMVRQVVSAPTRPTPPPPRPIQRGPSEERKALPHKEPERQSFSFDFYFDRNASPYPTPPPSRREILPVAVEWKEKMRPGELYQIFRRFFDANEIGNRILGTLREGAAAILEFEGDPQIYKIVKVRGRALFEPGRPASAEVYLRFSRHAVESLLAPNATRPQEYVQRVVSLLRESDPERKIEVKLLSTHGDAMRKGYLGLVAAGGRLLAEALIELRFSLPADFVRHLT